MNQRGLSLVELMVALSIGSCLMAGAITVYVRSSATYAVNESLARLQEAARYALNTMEPDVRQAGFWGLMNEGQHITGSSGNLPFSLPSRAARCGGDFPLRLAVPLEGTNNRYMLSCGATGGSQSGTDVLIARRAESAVSAASNKRLQIYTRRDGRGSEVFLGDTAPRPTVVDPLFGPDAQIHDLLARAYYISRDSIGQAALPALRRKTLRGGEVTGPDIADEEIMSGIEDLQVQFGIDPGIDSDGDELPDDTDADGQPDAYAGTVRGYVNPEDPALGTSRIISARLWIRVRAEAPEIGYTDDKTYRYADVAFRPAGASASYRRLVVSRTIYLHNAGGLQ